MTGGVPRGVIAAQLGHRDTRMAEKHYAHLAPSYVADTVPRFRSLDLSTNGKDYPNILRPHATVVVYGWSSESMLPTLWLMRNSITLRLFLVSDLSASDRDACLAELGALLQSNRQIHTVERSVPLDDIALAHELSERGEVIGIVLGIG
jgi:zinc-binding alcohol dehydrogenase family protein